MSEGNEIFTFTSFRALGLVLSGRRVGKSTLVNGLMELPCPMASVVMSTRRVARLRPQGSAYISSRNAV